MTFRFHALAYSETIHPLPPKIVLSAGGQWAKVAQRLILETLDTVTNENLMVSISLFMFDYQVLIDDRQLCFFTNTPSVWAILRMLSCSAGSSRA